MGGGGHVPIKSSPGTYAGVADAPPVSGPGPAPVPPPEHAPAGIAGAVSAFSSNADVPGDVQSSTLEDLDRRMRALEAARKFPAQDADAAQQMQGVGAQASGQQATQMIQQVVSGITGAIGGAVGGLMKPLEEIPQQAMQAMQPLMSALHRATAPRGSRPTSSLWTVSAVNPVSAAARAVVLAVASAPAVAARSRPAIWGRRLRRRPLRPQLQQPQSPCRCHRPVVCHLDRGRRV